MIAGLRLAPLFLRRGNRGDDLTALGLTAVGIAVATALTLVALSLRPALDARDDRMAWREPTAAPQDRAIAVQRRSADLFEHRPIDRVDLAPLAGTTPERSAAGAEATSVLAATDGADLPTTNDSHGRDFLRIDSQRAESGSARGRVAIPTTNDSHGRDFLRINSQRAESGSARDGLIFPTTDDPGGRHRTDFLRIDSQRAEIDGASGGLIFSTTDDRRGSRHGTDSLRIDSQRAEIGGASGGLVLPTTDDPGGRHGNDFLRGDSRRAVGGLPAPPGLARFPAEGEVFVSPALGRLLEGESAERLGDRFPGRIAGTIGPAGLAHEDELVVVVGHAAGALEPDPPARRVPFDARLTEEPSAATPIDGFATTGDHPLLESYKMTASLAAVLLAVPALLLLGSAARLTAARRNQRLASLRLAGATPGAVVVLTAAETAVAALAGALAGVLAYAALLPLLARATVAGGRWRVGDLSLGGPELALTVAGAVLLAGVCAAVALRRVVISPLGVAQRAGTRRPRSVRLLGMVAAWVVLWHAAQGLANGDDVLGVLLVGLGVLIGSLAMVGPWITWLLGALLARLANRPATLLAARRIVDDPKGAYRAISGIVLAGLVAGFLFTLAPVIEQLEGRSSDDHALEAWIDAPAAELDRAATAGLAAAGIDADVRTEGDGGGMWSQLTIDPPAGSRLDVEHVRTALAGLPGNTPLLAAGDDVLTDRQLVHDFRRASLALSIATMVMAATTTAIASSASILDQRPTLRRLRLAGTPIGTLQRARTWQASLPLVAATVGSLAAGAAAATLLLAAAGNAPEGPGSGDLATLLGVVGAGLALAAASAIVTRPLLVAATEDPVVDR